MAQSPAIPAPCITTHLERTSIHETGLSETHLMVTHRIVSNEHIIVCLFVWADGIWGTNMKTYANYRHNAPYSWTFSGKRTPRTEGGNLWEKHGFVGWQCSLSSHVSCADGPAQKDREDTRFGRITWAQNKWATIKAMSKYICECLATSMAVSENAGPKLVGSQIS